ncbi:MAG: TIGR04282 family arsenosugar biosynthesis glycosyltransferase [Xanthobacteraceae bacterium]|nr:TIGR04282 family arsenosugar biosynthesis glycosyltransferase [Xanthobacteraceae bacterium]
MAAAEPVSIAVLAKAPVAGFAKTRLIPALGAGRAAKLQARLTDRAAEMACAAATGPVTVWATPDETHPTFKMLATHRGVALARQPDGDLGARILAGLKAPGGPTLVIGTDCPAMMPAHLRKAADVLRGGADAVVYPAEDGGYVLIGMRKPLPALFAGMRWSTSGVMDETRRRLRYHRLTWQEPVTLWDVDVPEDLPRLRGLGLLDEFSRR